MAKPDMANTQDTLDSLRRIRRQLYVIPDTDLSAMSLNDQIKYASALHQMGTAILNLEAAALKDVNDEFKKKEMNLSSATAKIESDIARMNDVVKMIRAVSEGMGLVTKIIALLG